MVKIITGVSSGGGSTIILINLTNLFNSKGIDTTLYGPKLEGFHMGKCKSADIKNLKIKKNDIIMAHHVSFDRRPDVKKIVLACHEKWWYEVADQNVFWDTVVFNHQEHRNYHNRYLGPYVLIPNPKDFNKPLFPKDKPELDKVAGVIGSIEDRKQTHLSIEKALEDGCEKVLVFGKVHDVNYYNKYCRKYYFHPYVTFMDYSNNKQEMYDSIGRVYHMSKGEVSCLVKDECHYTNTKFFGTDQTNHIVSDLTNDEIFDLWKDVLKF